MDNNIELAKAAAQLGVGSKKLFAALRDKGVLSNNNIATLPYVNDGYFEVVNRSYQLHGYKITKYYTITLVTGKGMSFLQEVVNEMAAANEILLTERRGLSHQQSHGERPTKVQRVGTK